MLRNVIEDIAQHFSLSFSVVDKKFSLAIEMKSCRSHLSTNSTAILAPKRRLQLLLKAIECRQHRSLSPRGHSLDISRTGSSYVIKAADPDVFVLEFHSNFSRL